MTSLSFPELNVWVAVQAPGHVKIVRRWWEQHSGEICFIHSTQLGYLRLCTTAAATDGNPLTMAGAWRAYARFFDDDRVRFHTELAGAETEFRRTTSDETVSPKVWADAWLLAIAQAAGGLVVTLDRALAGRGAHCLLGGS
jgi:predicted nucleic acid-binding protein